MITFRPKFFLLNDEKGKLAYNLYRNVARFYLEDGYIKEDDEFYPVYLFKFAQSCEMVGDFWRAEAYLNSIRQKYPEWNVENMAIEYEHLEKRRGAKFVDVECDDQRLKKILESLVSVFYNINKNISAFIVEDEEEYRTLALTKLGCEDEAKIFPYDNFAAVGYYERPGIHCLVFKRSSISDNDDNLTGLCAHELAHFELHDTHTVEKTLQNYGGDIYLFREWTTDIHVIQKGFAYELFIHRKENYSNSETRILTGKDIECFVQKIANYSETL